MRAQRSSGRRGSIVLFALCAASLRAAPSLVTDFPGGNGMASNLAPDRFLVAPDLRDTQKGEWWFYWNVALRDAAGPVDFVFAEKKPLGTRGPAVSFDEGFTWSWMGASAVKSSTLAGKSAWTFAATSSARYAFAPQYLGAHLAAWQSRHTNDPAFQVEELCRSRKGRPVEVLHAGTPGRDVILLTSRHHCCETMATYALEGLLETVLSESSLRDRYEFIAVPFMDKDGCEDGDQGKNRAPHDHNRDYNEKPLYPEVAALMHLGASMSNRVVAAFDLHCPYISGEWNDRVYMVGSTSPALAEKQRAFAKIWAAAQTGPIHFREQDVLAYGTSWNTSNNYRQGRSASAWARDTFPAAKLVTTIEIPYADALGVEVNADSARALGRDLASALNRFLRDPETP